MPSAKHKLTLDAGMRIPAGAVNGYVLKSDASGNGTWQPASLSGAAGGELAGTYPNPTIAAVYRDRERGYVQSRLLNLITNGSGLMGDNTNFSTFAFDAVETHGGGGSFRKNVSQQGATSDELIPIDPERAWRLIGWAKSGDASGANFNAANKQYFGIAQLDIDGLPNTYANNGKFAGSTDTTLAVALNPGDPTITLTDATGWNNVIPGVALSRRLSWWPYTNAKGYTWADYTYTRNLSVSDLWAGGQISGNVITLRVPWAGPALPAGTKVRNAADGGNAGYKYIAAANVTVPNVWTRYEGYLMGSNATGNPTATQFEVGTAFIKLLFLINYHGAADNNIRWSDLALTDLSVRNLENPAQFPGTIIVDNPANIAPGSGKGFIASGKNWGDTSLQAFYASNVGASADAFLSARTADAVMGTTKAIPLLLTTNSAARLQIQSAGRIDMPFAVSAAAGLTLGASQAAVLYAPSADYLVTDDQLGVPYSQTYPTIRTGLRVGHGGGWTLQAQAGLDSNGDAALFHNAYRIYNDAAGVFRWNAAHGSFGSRGIVFGYTAGIRFFADQVAATADATFTPTERMRLTNDGTLLIGTITDVAAMLGLPAGTTPATGGIMWGTDTNLYRLAAGNLATDNFVTIQPTGTPVSQNMLSVGPGAALGDSVYALFGGRARFGYGGGIVRIDDAGLNKAFGLFLGAANNQVLGVNAAGQMTLPAQGGTGGLVLGGDVNLYRSAADTLKTDDNFQVDGDALSLLDGVYVVSRSSAGNQVFDAKVAGDTWPRIGMHVNPLGGSLSFGPGGSTLPDVNLYRPEPDTLKTDDDFHSAGLRTTANLRLAADGISLIFGALGDVNLYRAGANRLATDDALQVGGKISNVTDPTAAQEAATKNYVDTRAEINISTAGPSPRVGELLWVDTDDPGGITPVSLVSALPSSPVDGQECYYHNPVMEALGIIWHLRYNAVSASAYKWEYLGGSDLQSGPQGAVVHAVASEIALTSGPTLTVPLSGDYRVGMRCRHQLNAAALVGTYSQLAKNGSIAGLTALYSYWVADRQYMSSLQTVFARIANLAAADVLSIRVRNEQAVSVTYDGGGLEMYPIRVG